MQRETRDEDGSQDTIKRLKETEISTPLQDEEKPLLVYAGPKQPKMPNVPTVSTSDNYAQSQNASKQRSGLAILCLEEVIFHHALPAIERKYSIISQY